MNESLLLTHCVEFVLSTAHHGENLYQIEQFVYGIYDGGSFLLEKKSAVRVGEIVSIAETRYQDIILVYYAST
jgi:hypothetical protein